MGIRNSAKAVILQDEKLLAIKKQDRDGYYYILPGGGQEHGENLHEALKRECIEEINADVEVGDLIFIREYIGKNHEHFEFDSHLHQTEYMFLCKIKAGNKKIGNGTNPDDGQLGVEWLPLSELFEYRIYPQTMRGYLQDYFAGKETPTYLGDIN
ncbi:NUDIX domain-containing protein [Bacillus sp. FJAT-49705]|uniref:NUDIX domain-containing protein n=1 Tax=Cytobacillus citreus TaxID=2833586 RepID=A0ABS5NPM3_9BACI|nr:NUDIX domain-containing protein [Cytobacillus citreus]MBS4189353.1 NUDIX domain-containing protein [Cytobacillus citreus]